MARRASQDGTGAPAVKLSPLWRVLLPYAAVPLIGVLALSTQYRSGNALTAAGSVSAFLLVGLIVLRQVSIIVENRRLYAYLGEAYAAQGQGLARRVAELEWLRDVSKQVNTARSLIEVLDVAYDGVKALDFDRVGINLFNVDDGIFEDWVGTDAEGRKIWPQNRVVQLTPESTIWRFPGVAAALGGDDMYYTENAAAECPADLLYLYDGAPTHNLMVTLRSGETVVGNISVDNLVSGRPITVEDAGPLLALANQVGTAVERARALEELRHQALYDPLTGLPNRALLLDRLGQALRAAPRDRAAHALLLIDLNRFKEVNDTLGHQVGDALLQQVGGRLQETLRATDTVARLGGDEFAVLLPATDSGGASDVAAHVLAVLDAPFLLDQQSLEIGASIGVALSPDHGTDHATLLRHADVAMYVAKRAGGGYALYDADCDGHSRERLALMGDLRQALAHDQLALYYQPLIDSRHDSVYGVEALLRWRHPERGLIPPDQFIPLAEQSGLILPLTDWIVEKAVQQCAEWRHQGLELSISVNLSMRTLHERRLPAALGDLLRRYAVAPELITLEITESSLMTDPAQVLTVLTQLDMLGVRLSIDDFGTGYSSLAYLRQLPVDEIKIDRSFILGINTDSKDIALVRSIVVMAHALGLSIVAEGVETRQVYEMLRAQGPLKAQGYYFSPPLSPDQLTTWLATATWGRYLRTA
ncbi:MAG TPA: EAL domain-containing protein [Chloroflexota bacterium]|nr:EAL domain-containing protein [Chloroflexota bacterium]